MVSSNLQYLVRYGTSAHMQYLVLLPPDPMQYLLDICERASLNLPSSCGLVTHVHDDIAHGRAGPLFQVLALASLGWW